MGAEMPKNADRVKEAVEEATDRAEAAIETVKDKLADPIRKDR